MKLVQQPGEGKSLISKQKALSFSTTNTFCMKNFLMEIAQVFIF